MSWWDAALGTVAGGAIVIAGNYQSARMADRRDQKEWDRRRHDVRLDEQRAAVKDLQGAVARTYHASFSMQLGGEEDTALLESYSEGIREMLRLEARVGDDELRRLSREMRTTGTMLTARQGKVLASPEATHFSALYDQICERVAELLRSL